MKGITMYWRENRLKPLDWLLIVVVLVFVIVAFARGAEAQLVRVTSESEPRQVCRIVNGQKTCETVRATDYGTGVIVDRDARYDYVLTAAHVVDQTTHAVHGRPAKLVATHATEDLALLRMPRSTWDVATLGDDPPTGLAVYLDGLGDSGKADAKNYRQARGQIISERTVSHPSRDGDSGGGVSVGSTLYGIITHTDATRTQFVPVSICRIFCRQNGVCRPPASVRTAPVPGPPADIPDRQKVARIESLEAKLARMEAALVKLTTIVDAKTSTPGKPGADGTDGRNGTDGKDGRTDPIEVRIVSVDDGGKRTIVRHMSFQPGEPIDLVFHEKFLREEQ